MLLSEVAATSADVTVLPGRRAKVARLAACLRAAAADQDPTSIPVAVAYLVGELRQRRTGLGYASLKDAPRPGVRRGEPLTIGEVDAAFARAQATQGPGSQVARREILFDMATRADEPEARFVAGLLTGELRQGAARGLLLEAVAFAGGASVAAVRRAVTLSGSLAEVALAVLGEGHGESHGMGPDALAAFGLRVGRPLTPMLAKSAVTVAAAVADLSPAAVEWKLDGVRIQAHRDGEQIRVFTRTLDNVTERLPEVVAALCALPVRSVVLDGEVIALGPDGRPRPFQQTAARFATQTRASADGVTATPLTSFFFDVLHLDGQDLTGQPLRRRRAALESLQAFDLIVPHLIAGQGSDAIEAADRFAADALARGHEGVVVKALDSSYEMGRRGAGWVKVKPVHTLDLVVLAAEWGHGRRTGWLSNLHLAARDPQGAFGPPGGFVMLGKTFKGLTDKVLAWQTQALAALASGPTDQWIVHVKPELVVEIAFDGVQRSTRYPGGVALRFARVVRYRDDKRAEQADTIETVRGFLT